jgi:antitoxin MazE
LRKNAPLLTPADAGLGKEKIHLNIKTLLYILGYTWIYIHFTAYSIGWFIMLSKVQKWGNSQGIRIPKNLLENSHIKIGEEVNISVKDGKIIVEPTHKIHGKYDIKDLVCQMPADYQAEEVNWGVPSGQEVW